MTTTEEFASQDVAACRERVMQEMAKVIVGQHHVIEHLLLSLLCRGHILVVGLPGLAKTLIAKTFAQVTHLKFSRIQFTPDMMPSDITGVEVLEEEMGTGRRVSRFIQGPIFANIILADEINRTPPRTQAAMLQVMQENQVTISKDTFDVAQPFQVIATQNPIEQEGTYPLPEAQLDRFMFKLDITYPGREEEIEMLRATTAVDAGEVAPVLSGEQILSMQEWTRAVPVADDIHATTVDLVRSTRPDVPQALDSVQQFVQWGASPRACQFIILAAKARALLHGNLCVAPEDLAAVAPAVLSHRILLNYQAKAEDVSVETIVDDIIRKKLR
jgi:MoxR-like ATPase